VSFSSSTWQASRQKHIQLDGVADSVVLAGALALDGATHVNAGARVDTDECCSPLFLQIGKQVHIHN